MQRKGGPTRVELEQRRARALAAVSTGAELEQLEQSTWEITPAGREALADAQREEAARGQVASAAR